MTENSAGDEGEQAFATEGAEGARMSTYDENVASSQVTDDLTREGTAHMEEAHLETQQVIVEGQVVTDDLVREGNVSNREIIVLLNSIRLLCIVILMGLFLVVSLKTAEFKYNVETRHIVEDINVNNKIARDVVCDLSRQVDALSDNFVLPPACLIEEPLTTTTGG